MKKWTDKIVSNSLFLQGVIDFYNRLSGFSVTKTVFYKDVFVNNFCYPALRLMNFLVVDVDFFFDLLSRWPLNLDLISSNQRCNGNGNDKIHGIVFVQLWTLTTWSYNLCYKLRWCCFYQCVFTGTKTL